MLRNASSDWSRPALAQLRQLHANIFFSRERCGVAAMGRGFAVANPNVVKTKLAGGVW